MLDSGDILEFDFYAIKIFGESKASGDCFLGFITGKYKDKIEYRFICFPVKFIEMMKISLDLDFSAFREQMNTFFRSLIAQSYGIGDLNSEFSKYFNSHIRKLGGNSGFSFRISTIIEEGDLNLIKNELKDLMKDWTSEVSFKISVQKKSFKELSESSVGEEELKKLEELSRKRNDLIDLSNIFPVLDPMDGKPISELSVGSHFSCIIISFSDEDLKEKTITNYPEKFDETAENKSPFQGVLISKESLSPSSPFLLIKVQIEPWLVGKAVVMKPMKILINLGNPEKNFLPKNEAETENPSNENISDIVDKISSIENLESKKEKTPLDFILTGILLFSVLGALLALVYYFIL